MNQSSLHLTDKLTSAAVVLSVLLLVQCQDSRSIPYPATIRPVSFLIERVAGSRMSEAMVHPGRNPETYDPSVADLMLYRDCRALFFVAPALDGWAANFQECPSYAIVPEAIGVHHHGAHGAHGNSPGKVKDGENGISGSRNYVDPHFWTDPHRIEQALPRLQDLLISMEPGSAIRIRSEIRILAEQMRSLEEEAARRLVHLRGKRAVLMHPTYESFLAEHGIEVVAIVEPVPGKELSVKDWRNLLTLKPVDFIVHEKQLPIRQSRILARELDATIVELDPMGSSARNLTELLRNQLDAFADLRVD